MRTLKNILILSLIVFAGAGQVVGQTTKKDKQVAKEADIRSAVESHKFTFLANYVLPQRGGGHALTSDYDFRVTKDSLIAYLPYFGRAYFDVPYNPTDGGIKFTSTKFDYKVKEKKKGGWEISIVPSDVKNLAQLMLYISPDGYGTLSVNSTNRDYITFNGNLKDTWTKK